MKTNPGTHADQLRSLILSLTSDSLLKLESHLLFRALKEEKKRKEARKEKNLSIGFSWQIAAS